MSPVSQPLVLLAPFPLDARVWDDVRSRLDVPSIAVDPPGFAEALRGLAVPSLVMHGSADALMGPELQFPMARALGVGVETVDDGGHLLSLGDPERVVSALTELWRRATVRC